MARIHVHKRTLVELCKWECEVGNDELFPFDAVKKCDEIHKVRKLGRPSFRPHRYAWNKRYTSHRQAPGRHPCSQNLQAILLPEEVGFRSKVVPGEHISGE